MSETKRALSVGQTESARMECAGARIEGERNSDPQQVLYQEKSPLSTLYEKKVENDGTFINEYRCAWCGKVFIPTRPEYAWDDCCSYTCCLRYDEKIKQEGLSEKVVMMSAYDKRELMLFECAQDAADYLGVRRESVRDACNGRTKTCKGYAFRWAEKGKTDIERTVRKYTRSDRRKNHSITTVISLAFDAALLIFVAILKKSGGKNKVEMVTALKDTKNTTVKSVNDLITAANEVVKAVEGDGGMKSIIDGFKDDVNRQIEEIKQIDKDKLEGYGKELESTMAAVKLLAEMLQTTYANSTTIPMSTKNIIGQKYVEICDLMKKETTNEQ